MVLTLIAALMLGCTPGPTSSDAKLSGAFFNVPTSLTGPVAQRSIGARTLTSDAWVKSAVESYYATVRDQVRFGVEAAGSLKALLMDLEEVKIGNTYLLDSQTNLTYTAADGRKYRWTTEAAGSFLLEVWSAAGGKSVELRFTRDGSHYAGTVVGEVANLGWADPVSPAKNPEWVKAEFDTNYDGLGTARLALSVTQFRYHADLNPGLEDGIMVLTKDSSGVVRLGSLIGGDNSRHFIWNGYIRDASNGEVVNTGVSGEKRYYAAAGTANTSNQATVYMGIPTSVDATVFTGNGIGSLVSQLFADRLNNNYDFDGSQDTASDQGHEIVALLNSINSISGPTLNTAGTVYANTAAEVVAALQAAQANLGTPDHNVEYLLSMMSVTNPAYFVETTYQSYGASVPTGWPLLAESDARLALPSRASVDALSIAFESSAAPGF